MRSVSNRVRRARPALGTFVEITAQGDNEAKLHSAIDRAFNAIATADAMGKPELLANGISQALLTTAAGLTVAIPAYVAHLFFSSRVDRLVMDIDHLGQKVVNGVACDGFKEKPVRKKRARAV